MEDTASRTTPRAIAGHPTTLLEILLGPRRVRLHAVPALEDLVDRAALLRGDAEPPYWAYLWSGARVLAAYLVRFGDLRGRRVLEIGCGLALPGITAAVLGADVTLVDGTADALAFATASAAANGVRCLTRTADFFQLDPRERFDLVLAAEVAYDRARYADLAAVLTRHVLPGGAALLADGYRTDTSGLYRAFAAVGWRAHAVDVRVVEEGNPITVRVSIVAPADAAVMPRDIPPSPA